MSPPPITQPTLGSVMMDALGCLCDELENTIGGPVCWCGLWHGEPVTWDYCDGCAGGKCGMAYARVLSVYPFETFPVPAIDQTCLRPLAYAIEIGVMRCFPIMDEDGSLPDGPTVSDAVLLTYDDIGAMRRALLCCTRVADVWIGEYTALNEGGCAGGSWTAFISLEP